MKDSPLPFARGWAVLVLAVVSVVASFGAAPLCCSARRGALRSSRTGRSTDRHRGRRRRRRCSARGAGGDADVRAHADASDGSPCARWRSHVSSWQRADVSPWRALPAKIGQLAPPGCPPAAPLGRSRCCERAAGRCRTGALIVVALTADGSVPHSTTASPREHSLGADDVSIAHPRTWIRRRRRRAQATWMGATRWPCWCRAANLRRRPRCRPRRPARAERPPFRLLCPGSFDGPHRWHHGAATTTISVPRRRGRRRATAATARAGRRDAAELTKLDLHAIGGEAGIDGRHDGERPWRAFGARCSRCCLGRGATRTTRRSARALQQEPPGPPGAARAGGHDERTARGGAAALSLTAWAFGAGAALDASLPPSPPPAATPPPPPLPPPPPPPPLPQPRAAECARRRTAERRGAPPLHWPPAHPCLRRLRRAWRRQRRRHRSRERLSSDQTSRYQRRWGGGGGGGGGGSARCRRRRGRGRRGWRGWGGRRAEAAAQKASRQEGRRRRRGAQGDVPRAVLVGRTRARGAVEREWVRAARHANGRRPRGGEAGDGRRVAAPRRAPGGTAARRRRARRARHAPPRVGRQRHASAPTARSGG